MDGRRLQGGIIAQAGQAEQAICSTNQVFMEISEDGYRKRPRLPKFKKMDHPREEWRKQPNGEHSLNMRTEIKRILKPIPWNRFGCLTILLYRTRILCKYKFKTNRHRKTNFFRMLGNHKKSCH